MTKNKQLPIYHEGERVGTYVPDIVVEDRIVIELKCKPRLILEDQRQFWHYLKYRLGFLVNFGYPGGVEIERRVFDTARDRRAVPSA